MKRRDQSGFALLFVFAMAAIIAITLYVALPRVAFEAQRDKEELLIVRGEQYKRAIQLYVRKFKRFPGKIEDLDNANGIRFLRHHYVDPMTGKDEWRLIHAGPGGVLLDSLVKTKKDKKEEKAPSTFITEQLQIGGVPEADAAANPALRRRPSDQPGGPVTSAPGAPGGNPGAPIPPDPSQTVLLAPTPGIMSAPGSTSGADLPVAGLPVAGLPVAGAGPGSGLEAQPGTLNAAGSAVNSQTGGVSAFPAFGGPSPAPNQPQVPGQVVQRINGGLGSGSPGSDAARLIQGLLTTPRPGGLAGIQNGGAAGQVIGGGIAGVASTVKTGEGIKIYQDQEEYKKWEFVYDAAKEAQNAGGIPQQGRPPGTPIGQSPAGQPFGPAGSFPGGSFPGSNLPGANLPGGNLPGGIPPK